MKGIADCSSVKVLRHTQNYSFIWWDLFGFVTPLPRYFERCFYSLCSSVHGKHHIKVKEFCYKFGKAGEDIVIKGS